MNSIFSGYARRIGRPVTISSNSFGVAAAHVFRAPKVKWKIPISFGTPVNPILLTRSPRGNFPPAKNSPTFPIRHRPSARVAMVAS